MSKCVHLMKMSDDHNRSCLCSSCSYRSVSEKPSLRRIIAEGSRIEKLYLGKFIPFPRNKNLIKKYVTPKTEHDHVRKEEFESEANLPDKVPATSKKELRTNIKKTKDIDSNSVILGLISLKNEDEIIQSRISINICTCCSCNSSIIAREAGTRYIRDNVSGKKMYRISKSRKKKESRNIGSPKAKPIRSEPTTKSTPSSSVGRAIKVKSSICPLYNGEYQSVTENLKYSYGTMGEGNLPTIVAKNVTKPFKKNPITSSGDKLHTTETETDETKNFFIENKRASKHTLKKCFCTSKLTKYSTGAKDITKPSLITKEVITSVRDTLQTNKTEIESNETKSFYTKGKSTTKSMFKRCFRTLKQLKEVNAKPKGALNCLREIENDFPKSINSKRRIPPKPKQHKPFKLTPKSNKFQKTKKKTISKVSIKRHRTVKRNICSLNKTHIAPKQDKTTFSSCFDTYYIENIVPSGKTLSYPKRETIFSSTKYKKTNSEKSIVNHQKPQSRIHGVNKPKENLYSSQKKIKTNSNARITNLSPEQETNENTLIDQQAEISIMALQNFHGNSCLDKKRRKCFKSTINRCFCKLVPYGKDNEKFTTDGIAQLFCGKTSSVRNKKQQDKVGKPIYKDLLKLLGSYKKREKSLNLSTSSMPEKSVSSMSYDSSVDSRIGTKMRKVNRRREIQHVKCSKYRKLIKERKVPYWNATSSLCITFSCQNIMNSSILSLKSKFFNFQQYEWKPMNAVSRSQTNIMKQAKKDDVLNANLRRCSCMLLRKKNRNTPHLSIATIVDAGSIRKSVVSHPTCQSIKDLQYFEHFSSNSKNSTWQQTIPLQQNSFTGTNNYSARLGHHMSSKRLNRSLINHFINKKESSGIETDLRSTMLSYHHLKQFCVMNLNIAEPKIKRQILKPFKCKKGGCVPNECDEFRCLNLIHKRFQYQTSTMTSTPISQVNQTCIHCEGGRINTHSQTPSSPESCCVQAKPQKQKRDPNKKTVTPPSACPFEQNICESVGLSCKRNKIKSIGMRDPSKGTELKEPPQKTEGLATRSINQNKSTLKTMTQLKEKDGLTLSQNKASQSQESEHVYPPSSLKRKQVRRRKKKSRADSIDTSTSNNNFPCSVTEPVNNKASSKRTPMRSRKRNSFTTVTVSGLITVCKKPKGIVVTQNSTCSFQSPSSITTTLTKKSTAGTATRKKKHRQKGTDPISPCVNFVGYTTTDEQNAPVTGHHPTKTRPAKIKEPLTAYDKGAMTYKVNPEYDGIKIKIRERGVGTIRPQSNSVSSTTEPSKARNRQFTRKQPKEPRGLKSKKGHAECTESCYSYNVVFSTDKVGKQKSVIKRRARFGNRNSATSLKRCFCTTALIKSKNQKVYCMPFITKPNLICDYQREHPEVFLLPRSELDVKQMNHKYKLYYAPYEFLPIECDPGEYIERVIKRKQYKKIKKSDKQIKYSINFAHSKTKTCKHYAQLLTSNIDNQPVNTKLRQYKKYNKELTRKQSYIYCSTESTEVSSLLDDNSGIVKSYIDFHSDLASDTSQVCITDSIGMMCNTGDLTGMSPHLNKHIYALRLETSPKTARVGVGNKNKRGEVKIVMGPKGTRNNRSQAKFGPYECKASDCALGNFNPKMCEKIIKERMQARALSPGECDPNDCALGNYNPKKCEKIIAVRTATPRECAPGDCALGNYNPKKCQKRINARLSPTTNDSASQSVQRSTGNNPKKNEKRTKVKNKPAIRRQSTEKDEPKVKQPPHIVEDRRFKSLRYPFDTGMTITSSISLDIEFYRQERLPSLPLSPHPTKVKTSKPVPIKKEKHSDQPKTRKVAQRRKKKELRTKTGSPTSIRSISVQAKRPEQVNVIKKCFCTLMRMTSTKDKKNGPKQINATGAEIGVTTKDKYLEPKVFYPDENFRKPKKVTRTFCGGTTISRRTFSTMTDKKTPKSAAYNEIRRISNYNQTEEKSSSTMTPKIKLRKVNQNVVHGKTHYESIQAEKRKMPDIHYSDFNITSKISFDVELCKYEKTLKNENERSSTKTVPIITKPVPVIPKPVPITSTPKDKTHSRKVATKKMPGKSSSDTVIRSKNRPQSSVHPSLKRCFCTMKLQKQQQPYGRQQTVNFMTTTITPLNISKYRLINRDKSSNVYSNTFIIHDTVGKSNDESSQRYSKSKIYNDFLNRFANSFLSKLFRKSLDAKHALIKQPLMQVPDSTTKQKAFCNEMKTIYPYNSHKFNKYTSRTMVYRPRAMRSRFRRHTRKYYPKKRRQKRPRITETVQKDFIKRPNKENHVLNKLKSTFQSIIRALKFKRIKHKETNRENCQSNNHSQLTKRKKDLTVTTKTEILKTSKSDRQKCYVVNNVDPLKTCKSDRQPVSPKQKINQKKSKRVKVVSPRVFNNDKSNIRHSKYMEQGRKKYCRFQSGDIEILQNRKKDYLLKPNKHYFNNYLIIKSPECNPNVQKQRIQLTLKHKKKNKIKNKYGSGCCKERERWLEDQGLNERRKIKLNKSKNIKLKVLEKEETVKVGKRKGA